MLVEMGKMPDLRLVIGGADDRQSGRVGMVAKRGGDDQIGRLLDMKLAE